MRSLNTSICIIITTVCFSQTNQALGFYDAAGKVLAQKQYAKADSLYTRSLNLEPHPDAFFNRAACRQKLNDRKGYCEDLACAAAMKDGEALGLFCKECGKADTISVIKQDEIKKFINSNYNIRFKSTYFNYDLIGAYDENNRCVGLGWSTVIQKENLKKDSVRQEVTLADFPGGVAALSRYLITSFHFPNEAKEMGISGRVFVEFVVNQFGYLEFIEINKAIKDCPACNLEGLRVVATMPRWKPAQLLERNVDYYFILPIAFKTQ